MYGKHRKVVETYQGDAMNGKLGKKEFIPVQLKPNRDIGFSKGFVC